MSQVITFILLTCKQGACLQVRQHQKVLHLFPESFWQHEEENTYKSKSLNTSAAAADRDVDHERVG